MTTLANKLIKLLQFEGANLVGFADLHDIPSDHRHDLPVGISVAVALKSNNLPGVQDGPTQAYYAEYQRANQRLEILGQRAETFLREQRYRAMRLAVTEVGIDPKTHSTQLPHKTVATRAGLGWIGKCALLVTEPFGSAVRLTTVLTDADLPVRKPIDTSRCGTCRACVDACPGNAPLGGNWHVAMPRDRFFDVYACREAARDLAVKRIGIRNTICGICIAVCPWTKRYRKRDGRGIVKKVQHEATAQALGVVYA